MTDENLLPALEIKRYANRKLYVAEQGRYVNIPILYQMLLGGREIRVFCAKKREDITAQILGVVYQKMCIDLGYVDKEALLASIRKRGPAYDSALA